ncbi:unnamed protein product [Echinostoma caproni]|uniref:Uncharacterized protein n=1 Tax=Echinostoma caproni TaxID=27848 RepID=A0A183B5F8_9TREM|nr:unnamed protein product [Echinostoma caproni]
MGGVQEKGPMKLRSYGFDGRTKTPVTGNEREEDVWSNFYEEWNMLRFYSLETLPNGTKGFRATAQIHPNQRVQLTEHGRTVQRESMISGLFANRFRGFHGQLLRIGVIQEEPLLMCETVLESGQVVGARGMIVDIVNILAERFDFK